MIKFLTAADRRRSIAPRYVDGNDERGIHVGRYSKHPIRSMHGNVGLGLPGECTFRRDFGVDLP